MTSAPPDPARSRRRERRSVARARGGLAGHALWTLYTLTLRQHLHGKRWMVMAALFLLPAGLADRGAGDGAERPSGRLEFILAFMFIPQALLPLVALLYASGIIQDEQEEQTITYLLIRPIPKWADLRRQAAGHADDDGRAHHDRHR